MTGSDTLIRREAVLVDKMSEPLSQLDSIGVVAKVHVDTPEGIGQVEL